jgi:hypothetical protein
MKGILIFFFFTVAPASFSQTIQDSIPEEDAKKHITYLASDKLRGRVNFTNGQLKAAKYISNEFSTSGLSPFPEYIFSNPFIPKKQEC